MSYLGYFKCFDLKKNIWEDLEGINIPGDSLRGLATCNGILYCVSCNYFLFLIITYL